ncbi:uncharacterized protein LOC122509870 isoform X2 [Leptopilina heterotoma]|uniref:uncharacterized protein LOC122509870 isoform X2 n=1 Tax=Leptopilina heterotoma TaxID=63436 RepID=UPI001CA7C471|nr:uncharacterized protein LOC122509870 isoform X2 [Leptopilina heterotoma]
MAHLVQLKGKDRSMAKREVRISNKGRPIIAPHKLLSSEDEAPKRKNSKSTTQLKAELNRLKSVAAKRGLLEKLSSEGDKKEAIQNNENEPSTSLSSDVPKSKRIKSNTLTLTPIEPSIVPTLDQHVEKTIEKPLINTTDTLQTPLIIDPNFLLNDLEILQNPVDYSTNFHNIEEVLQETSNRLRNVENLYTEMSNDIKKIYEQNQKILQILEGKKNYDERNLGRTLFQSPEGFPLSSMEEYEDFKASENNEIIVNLKNRLIQIGGTKLREFLNYALKQLMTDELVSQFSWPGSIKSEKFGDTKISNLLFESAKQSTYFVGPHSISEFKNEMLEVLRITKQRYRKKNSNKQEVLEEMNSEEILEEIRRLQELDEVSDANDGDDELIDDTV